MKRLVCRRCGSGFFKYRQSDSCIECNKCKCLIKVMKSYNKKHEKVDYISILWENIAN